MTYVMADIHGCYEQYRRMLDKINFKDSDTLYVLGDVVDRGEHPMKVLRDMSMRANVYPIMGNHDYIAAILLERLSVEITENNYATHIDDNIMELLAAWLQDDGKPTLDDYERLALDERGYILEYLNEFEPYETVTVNGNKYILTHAGLPESAALHTLDRFDSKDYVTATVDYGRIYFKDAILVTGHTPTFHIGEEWHGKVLRGNNHLAIDTGGVFGENFACVCLDTSEEFYIK